MYLYTHQPFIIVINKHKLITCQLEGKLEIYIKHECFMDPQNAQKFPFSSCKSYSISIMSYDEKDDWKHHSLNY